MVKKLFGRDRKACGMNTKELCHRRRSCRLMPLSEKVSCGTARVCAVNGERKHCARLAALGLYPGNDIELIKPANGSECVVKVHGGTISIDRDTTKKIFIVDTYNEKE